MLRRIQRTATATLIAFAALSAAAVAASGCGTNTDSPVYPIFSAAVLRPGPPVLFSVKAVPPEDPTTTSHEVEFEIQYYITNNEEGFLGYNLHISDTVAAPDQDGSTTIFLPKGVEPSFSHSEDQPSTHPDDIVTQRLPYKGKPNPPDRFTVCNYYEFHLRAVTRSGIGSDPGLRQGACARIEGVHHLCTCKFP